MPLNTRNIDLINHIKNIWSKPVFNGIGGNYLKLYHTFSKTRFTVNSRITDAGIEYSLSLTVNYPGIKGKTFDELHDFLAADYVVVIQLNNDDYYQLSFIDNPLQVNSNFSIKAGIQLKFTGKQHIPIACLSEFKVTDINKHAYKLAFKL